MYSSLGCLPLLPRHLHTIPLQEYSLKAPWWDTSSPSKKFLPSEQVDFVTHKVNQKIEKGTSEAPEVSLGNHTDDTRTACLCSSGTVPCIGHCQTMRGGQRDGAILHAPHLSPCRAGVDRVRVWGGRPVAPGGPARRSPHGGQAAWREEFSMKQREVQTTLSRGDRVCGWLTPSGQTSRRRHDATITAQLTLKSSIKECANVLEIHLGRGELPERKTRALVSRPMYNACQGGQKMNLAVFEVQTCPRRVRIRLAASAAQSDGTDTLLPPQRPRRADTVTFTAVEVTPPASLAAAYPLANGRPLGTHTIIDLEGRPYALQRIRLPVSRALSPSGE